MILTTSYLGLDLKSPLVPSSSPLSHSLELCQELEAAGAGAIIMYSLFEEAITAEEETMARFLHHQDLGHGEAGSFLPDHLDFAGALDRYVEDVQRLKAGLGIPVIASLNGITPGGWIDHARELEAAGADALELNVYYIAADPQITDSQVEERYLEILTNLRQEIRDRKSVV
jgi:dihydroorotate dehydrogenase (fumarate)